MELVEVVAPFADLLSNAPASAVAHHFFYKRFDIVVTNACNFADHLHIGTFIAIQTHQ